MGGLQEKQQRIPGGLPWAGAGFEMDQAGRELIVADQDTKVRVLDLVTLQRELKKLGLELPGLATVNP